MTSGEPTIRLLDAVGAEGLGHARSLFRAYADEFAGSIAEILCHQGFDAEVAGLPGRYAPPSGCLLLAMDGDIAAGCVALRDLDHGTCEMKRLYVTPEHRGLSLGGLLVEEVIRRAERMGSRRMVLDSLPGNGRSGRPVPPARVRRDRPLLGAPDRARHLHGEVAPRRNTHGK